MEVTFYHRRPREAANYSVEGYFNDIRGHLPASVTSRVATSRFESKGVLARTYNIFEATFRQSDVNHITGDVHFLSYLLAKRRTVLTVLDCAILNRKRGLRRELLRQLWFNIPVNRVSRITVISEATRADLVAVTGCDPSIIRVIPVSISHKFRSAPKPFNASKPTILQVGTGPNKNLERAAEALEGISCTLNIIGRLSPSQLEALKRYRIEYTNSYKLTQDEVVSHYDACDLVLFASTVEGFGMPIVEANAVGRAVVTSNCSSMPEVAGDAAHLVDPFDSASIRDGILRVVGDADYRARLLENGARNHRRFSAEQIAKQYYELYEEVLELARRG